MNKKRLSAIFGLLIILILAACQAAPAAGNPQTSGNGGGQGQGQGQGQYGGTQRTRGAGGNFQNNPAFLTRVASNPQLQTQIASGGGFGGGFSGGFGRETPTPTLLPTIADTPEPTATTASPTAGAEQTVQNYFADLQSGNFNAASQLVSAFSLMQAQTTAGTVAGQLAQMQQQGSGWSNLKIVDSQMFDDTTALVHVQYQMTGSAQPISTPSLDQPIAATSTPTPAPTAASGTPGATSAPIQKDEVWAVRQEAGKWMFNWQNVIDFETLNTTAQQISGLTIAPLKMTRYTDHLTLTLLAQNSTNDSIVIGQTGQTIATFHFGSQSVDATNTRYIIDSFRSYSDVQISVPGLYKTYPDSVDIIKYKNYPNQKPWFTFSLAS